MKIDIITKKSFSVIGKLGQGLSNEGFKWVPQLWEEANGNFDKISSLAKVDDTGSIVRIWGAMSDIDEKFMPWAEQGKYLAGCEVLGHAVAPEGWSKWIIPSYRYAVVKCTQDTYGSTYNYMIKEYLPNNEHTLAGAVHEFYDPKCTNSELSLYFPIEKL